MFISLNWIKDWVDLSGLDEDKLIHQFTLSCAEVEGVEHKGADISGIITARIEKVEDVLAIGDEIMVIVTEIDDKGRVNLATKEAYENKKEDKDSKKKKEFKKPKAE